MSIPISFSIMFVLLFLAWMAAGKNKLLRDSFFLGCYYTACLFSIIQDVAGQQGYIEFIKKYWVEPSIFSWILFIGVPIIIVLALYGLSRKYRFVEINKDEGGSN